MHIAESYRLQPLGGGRGRHHGSKVHDFKEPNLRLETCCRWFELLGKDGHWLYSDVEICKIMGWTDYSMVLRYASIRGRL
ncbi:MAG: hypothetical protein EON54_11320 [Alcaligenaceae bacterium]|nr:MAG: hypothetical protein EON54_11320 [Alcaligenaceae bacterium]